MKARQDGNILQPTALTLSSYPNPFNPTTTVSYAVLEETHVRIAVFNYIGIQVAELVEATVPVGTHDVVWNADNLPSGTYFVRLITESTQIQKSVQLIK
mgnify:CR=1 FL=1